jgi:hypothetical protein
MVCDSIVEEILNRMPTGWGRLRYDIERKSSRSIYYYDGLNVGSLEQHVSEKCEAIKLYGLLKDYEAYPFAREENHFFAMKIHSEAAFSLSD